MTGPELPDGLVDSLRAGDLSVLNRPGRERLILPDGCAVLGRPGRWRHGSGCPSGSDGDGAGADRVNFMAGAFDAIDTYDFGGGGTGSRCGIRRPRPTRKRPFTDNEKAVVGAAFKVGLARDMGIVGTTPPWSRSRSRAQAGVRRPVRHQGRPVQLRGRTADTWPVPHGRRRHPGCRPVPRPHPRVAERDDVVDTGRVMKDVTEGDILVHDGRMVIVTSYDWPDGVGDDVTVWANDALTGDPLEWESTGGEVMPVVPGSPGLVDTTDVQPGMMIAHPETGERVLVSRLLPQSDWDENEIEVVTAPGRPPTTVRTTMDQLVVFGDDDAGWASVSASSVAPVTGSRRSGHDGGRHSHRRHQERRRRGRSRHQLSTPPCTATPKRPSGSTTATRSTS